MKRLLLLSLFLLLSACSTVREQPAASTGFSAPPATQTVNLTTSETAKQSQVEAAFFAVHIETSDHATDSSSVANEWPMLEAFVQMADQYGHKLTLEFQPQWAEYALQNPDKLAQIRAWEAGGHEIAMHHHGISHAAWDGYTNAAGYENDPKYRGTMDDAIALLNQLSASGKILTGGMTDELDDWPLSLIYATGTLGKSGGGLLSTPSLAAYRSVSVTEISYQGYQLQIGRPVSLAEIKTALEQAVSGQTLGVVTHPFDFWNNQAAFDDLFSLLQDYGIQTQSVAEIIAAP